MSVLQSGSQIRSSPEYAEIGVIDFASGCGGETEHLFCGPATTTTGYDDIDRGGSLIVA